MLALACYASVTSICHSDAVSLGSRQDSFLALSKKSREPLAAVMANMYITSGSDYEKREAIFDKVMAIISIENIIDDSDIDVAQEFLNLSMKSTEAPLCSLLFRGPR